MIELRREQGASKSWFGHLRQHPDRRGAKKRDHRVESSFSATCICTVKRELQCTTFGFVTRKHTSEVKNASKKVQHPVTFAPPGSMNYLGMCLAVGDRKLLGF